MTTPPPLPTLAGLARTFGKIGLLGFGGPAAQIALMHRIVVDEKRWLGEPRYLHALNYCMLLPGPEATQLATYAGWRLKGVPGGILAGLLFVVPGAAVILALAASYVHWGQVPLVAAMFYGIKASVVVIVIEALLRVARRALRGGTQRLVAAASFAGLFLLNLPFPLIILLAMVVDLLIRRRVWLLGNLLVGSVVFWLPLSSRCVLTFVSVGRGGCLSMGRD